MGTAENAEREGNRDELTLVGGGVTGGSVRSFPVISEKSEPVAFLLWGVPAIRAAREIRSTEGSHNFSCSAHPAAWVPGRLKPFAAVPHFSAANEHLGDRAIDWSLPHLERM